MQCLMESGINIIIKGFVHVVKNINLFTFSICYIDDYLENRNF